MNRIVSVVNGKGGVGKTTTAFNLASIYAEKYKVLLVDTDLQSSATWWTERSNAKFELVQELNPSLLSKLRSVQDYEITICDTPPRIDSSTLTSIIKASDYVILPSSLSPLDINTLIDSIKTVIAPLGVRYRVVFTRVDPRRLKEAMSAQSSLMSSGIPIFNSMIRAYVAHEKTVLEGVSIIHWKGGNSEASADYERLADELEREWRK